MVLLNDPYLVMTHANERTRIQYRNDLNLTLATMSVPARRVLFLMMCQVDFKNHFAQDVAFKVTATDYAGFCGITKGAAYRQLHDASLELKQQQIAVPEMGLLPVIPREGERGNYESNNQTLNVAQWVSYAPGSGYVEISPSRQMEPYICGIMGDYTTVYLLSVMRISRSTTANMYQFLRQSISSRARPHYIDIRVDELKECLGLFRLCGNRNVYSYPQYTIFKRDVINKALHSINQETELNVSVSVVGKRGRKVDMLRFSYFHQRSN